MGLDNGICVRRNEYTNNIKELRRFEDTWDDKKQFDFEVCYWRKCWNIRSMITFAIMKAYNNCESEPLTVDDVQNIINGLKDFNSKNWNDNGGSIWDWDDEDYPYSRKIKQDIKNLKHLIKLMQKYDLEVYFYDSY